MNKYFIFLLTLFCFTSCKVKKTLPQPQIKKTFSFPFEWIGHYKGQLDIYKGNKKSSSVSMELIIDNPNADGYYPWTIIYNTTDVRSYGLEAINPVNGHYRINEFNSIEIDGYLNNGHFVSRFDVMGSDLLIDYHRTAEGMEVAFFISKTEESLTTGNEIIGSDTIPEVRSFPMVVFQKALLTLQE